MNNLSTLLNLTNGSINLANNIYSYTERNKEINNTNLLEKIDEDINLLLIPKEEIEEMKNKYPNKVPIIIMKAKASKLETLAKQKYFVDRDIIVQQFKYAIQKKLNLKAHQALFLFNDFYLIDLNITIGALYNLKKNNNDILYLQYCEENAFGK
tara:strand:+ start:373 stop:834 length:462 start_codon:yes stop_codon:yes gene_type:complete